MHHTLGRLEHQPAYSDLSSSGKQRINLVVVLGPTASGKTRLGVDLARILNGEIISADSRQVYRGMDIGTGKDLVEYGDVPVHLVDIVEPGTEFNVFQFQRRFALAFAEIVSRGCLPIMVGGTGLYLDAVLKGYRFQEVPENSTLRNELTALSLDELGERLEGMNPRLHNTTDLKQRERLVRAIEIAAHEDPLPVVESSPQLQPLVFGMLWDRSKLRQRITVRLKDRLEQGMIAEVERLHAAGISYETLESYGLEYRYLSLYLRGEINRNDMFQKLNSAIHDFAKRQETWFRRMERTGTKIAWLNGDENPLAEARLILHNLSAP